MNSWRLLQPQPTREFLARPTFFTSVNSWRKPTTAPGIVTTTNPNTNPNTSNARCQLHQNTLPITPNHGKKIHANYHTITRCKLHHNTLQITPKHEKKKYFPPKYNVSKFIISIKRTSVTPYRTYCFRHCFRSKERRAKHCCFLPTAKMGL